MIATPLYYGSCSSGYVSDVSSGGSTPDRQYHYVPVSGVSTTKVASRKEKIALLKGCSASPIFQFILECLGDPGMNDLVKWSKKHPYGFFVNSKNFAEEWNRRTGKRESFLLLSRQLQVVEQAVVANQRILARDKTGHYRFFPDYKGTGLPLVPLHQLKAAQSGTVLKDVNGRNVLQHQNPTPPPAAHGYPRYAPPTVPAMVQSQYPIAHQQYMTTNQSNVPSYGFEMDENCYNMAYPSPMYGQEEVALNYYPSEMMVPPCYEQQQFVSDSTSTMMPNPYSHANQTTLAPCQHSLAQSAVLVQSQGKDIRNDYDYVQAPQQMQTMRSTEEQQQTSFTQSSSIEQSTKCANESVVSHPATLYPHLNPTARQLPSILAEFLTPIADITVAPEDISADAATSTVSDYLGSHDESHSTGYAAPSNEVVFGFDLLITKGNEPLQQLMLDDLDFLELP